MKRIAALSWFAAALAAQTETSPPPAFVEVVPSSATAFVHQPIDVVVRLGIDASFFATQAVPLFQQQLDWPFQVTVPWLFGAEDRAVEFVPPSSGTVARRIAVGDAVVLAVPAGTRELGGRRFDLLELRYRWTPLAAGSSPIAPVELRYAFATRFEEDFLRGKQPLDRQEASVLSPPLQLAVKALPTAGRPAEWTGAVGDFTVTAKTDQPTVALGDSFALEVTVAGEGNLDRFAPMPLPVLNGFHVQARVERRAPGSRTFVFEVLALREAVTEVPAVSFAAFSPLRGEYVMHFAGPVGVVVTPTSGPIEPRVQELIDAVESESRTRTQRTWTALVLFVILLVLGVRRSRRRRRRQRDALRRAFDALTAAHEPAAVQSAFETLCARCAGHDRFFGEGTWRTLRDTEAPEPIVVEAQRVHAALDAARFGGVPVSRDDVQRVALSLRAHGELVAT